MTAPGAAILRPLEAGEAPPAPPADPRDRRSVAALLLVGIVVLSALRQALYDPVDWHVAGLLGATIATVAVGARGLRLGRLGAAALTALVALALWTLASMLWSVAPGRSWIEANRVGLYVAVLVVALAALRGAWSRASAITGLGLGIAGLFVATLLVAGLSDPAGVFLLKRLSAPVAYINGAAGLAVVGLWPAIAVASQLGRPVRAAMAAGGASVLLSVVLLTQSRSAAPALLLSAVVVLALLPGRAERLVALTIAAAGAAAAAPWTLAVFADDRANPFARPAESVAQAGLLAPLATGLAVVLVWAGIAALHARRPAGLQRALRVVAVALVAVAALGTAAAAPTISRTADRALDDFRASRIDEGISSRFTNGGGNRYELWRVAIGQWRSAPVLGIGAGGYGVRWYQDRRVGEAIRQPHSLPLQALAELGVIGFALLLGFAGTVAAAVVRARRRAPDEALLLAGALGSVAAWAVHTSLDWMHNLPSVTAAALIAAACLLSAGDEPVAAAGATEPSGGGSRAGRVARLGLVGALTTLAASLGIQLAVTAYTARAERQLATDPPAARIAAQRAVRLDRYAVPAWIALAAAEARLGSYPRADAALAAAQRAEPDSYVPYALRGDLATRIGDRALARRFYGEAADRNPLDSGLAQLAGRTVVAP